MINMTNANKWRLTLTSYSAGFASAGFFTTIGLLIGPLSEQFGMDISAATKLFTWFTGAYFVGSIVTFFVLDHIRAKTMLLYYGVIVFIASLLNIWNSSTVVLPMILSVIGLLCGISTCTAGTIISKIWNGKHRQAALISQDAVFNVGGVVYPMAAALMLGAGIHWGGVYVIAAVPSVAVIILIVISTFDFEESEPSERKRNTRTEWPIGVILAGLFLFIIILCKYVVVIWMPNYAENYLNATPLESGELIARIFGVALIGSVIGAIVVSRMNIMLFVAIAVVIGFLSSMQFTTQSSLEGLMLMATLFGLSLSVLWSGFIAYGVAFVRNPSHKHVSYILFCGGLGSTVTPLASGFIVESFGVIPMFHVVTALYGLVLLIILAHSASLRMSSMRLGANAE